MSKTRKKGYSFDGVLQSLARKSDCMVLPNRSEILILSDTNHSKKYDLGNGSWGKMDYLLHYYGFRLVVVDSFDEYIKLLKNNFETV